MLYMAFLALLDYLTLLGLGAILPIYALLKSLLKARLRLVQDFTDITCMV
jgi:hypothetical protein